MMLNHSNNKHNSVKQTGSLQVYAAKQARRPTDCIKTLEASDINEGGHEPGKPGILRDFSELGKLREFSGNSVQPQGKIVTKYFQFVIQIFV